MEYFIWTDGAIKGHVEKVNPIGGVGFVINNEDGEVTNAFAGPFDGGADIVTNNSMELAAVILALNSIEDKSEAEVKIHSDSAYVVTNFNTQLGKWINNNYTKSDGKHISNEYLWRTFVFVLNKFRKVELLKVKGHSGDANNEMADQLANEGKNNDSEPKNLKLFIVENSGISDVQKLFEQFHKTDEEQGTELTAEQMDFAPTPDGSGKMPKFLSDFDSVRTFMDRVVDHDTEYVSWRGNRSAMIMVKGTKYPVEVGEFIFKTTYSNEGSHNKLSKRADNAWVLEPTGLALKRKITPEENERFKAEDSIFREPKAMQPFLEGMNTRITPSPTSYLTLENLPRDVMDAPTDNVFMYWRWEGDGESGGRSVPSDKYPVKLLECVRVMYVREDGVKKFNTWTMFEGGNWRLREPEDFHRLYGISELKQQPAITRLFVHEGEKTCREVRRKIEENELIEPLNDFLGGRGTYHISWGFGALTPNKVKWNVLVQIAQRMKIKEVVIIPDNDLEGRKVERPFAKAFSLSKVKASIMDTTVFKVNEGWDWADPIPREGNIITVAEGDRIYNSWVGAEPESSVTELLWATREYLDETGKVRYMLTDKFMSRIVYVDELNFYYDVEAPAKSMRDGHLDSSYGSISDYPHIAQLHKKQSSRKADRLGFKPHMKSGIVFDPDEEKYILNQYIDQRKPAMEGDVGIFLSYIKMLIPNDKERHELMRWVATIFKYPELKFHYGMLIVSTTQGVGKSTLINFLSHYLGSDHSSDVTDSKLTESNFNGFMQRKLLVACHEIYADKNYKAIDRLKGLITEDRIMINEKFGPEFTTDNYAKIICCSNSLTALAVDNEDRRWLVVRAWEQKMPKEFATRLYDFMEKSHGCQKLRHYFENVWENETFVMDDETEVKNEFIKRGEHAPSTRSKDDMIERNVPVWEEAIMDVLDVIGEKECTTTIVLKDVASSMGTRLPKISTIIDLIREEEDYFVTPTGDYRIMIPIAGQRRGQKVVLVGTDEELDASDLKGKDIVEDWRILEVEELKMRLKLRTNPELKPM